MRVFWLAIAMTAFLTSAPTRCVFAQAAPNHAEEAGHEHAEGEQEHAEEGEEHPTVGPHGGKLLELGEEEYHAELILDEEKDQISICLLDSKAEQEVAIEAPYVTINVKTADKPRQYRLPALYAEGQEQGPVSCFAIVSHELMEDIHHPESVAKLVIKIGKKPYSVVISHDEHEHEEHEHEEHEHAVAPQ